MLTMKMLLLKEQLKKNNLTLEELAGSLAVAPSRITEMCDDEKAALDFQLFEKICNTLNCDLGDLITRD